MRTNIDIDDELLKNAMKTGDFKSKRELVETGLRYIILLNKQKNIKKLKGKITWTGDLNDLRNDQ
jgi:Arc/MetJ family transcription regulator